MIQRREWARGVLMAAVLMLGFTTKGILIAPPSPPAQSGSGEFDTDRAIGRLQRVLGDQRPHPVDTAADDDVRTRLIAELRAIGLQPEVHEASDCSGFPKSRVISCARVRNVVATIPSRAPGRALLLDAHYDSTPTGPGAADDGLGVATLLQVGSILKQSPPPRPVTLLFNEGEEWGLNGSAAFVRTDPLARNVDWLINIDARGVTGPANMFETSNPNAAAIALFARGGGHAVANSLSTDFAKLIPNSTDAVKFKPMRWVLLNYAIIGNETRYHSPGDTVAALDRRSLYQVGTNVLAASRAMAGTANPAAAASGEEVFTDIACRSFIYLPLPLAAVVLALLLVAAFALAWKEKALTRPLLAAAGATFGGIVAAALVATAASILRPGDFWRAHPLATYLGVYAVLLAVMCAAWQRWARRYERARMRASAWLLITMIGAAVSVALPGATIFFLIAPAIALIGIALQERAPRAGTILVLTALIVQFLMFAELLALIEMLLIDGPLWAVVPLAALAALPALAEMADAPLRPAVALLAATSVSCWSAALALPRSSAERPASFSIDYFRDADHKTAKWGIAAKQAPLPAGYPGNWHKGILPYNGRTRWIADAPIVDTPAPEARLIASELAGAGRRVRIALSPGGGDAVSIRFAQGTKVLAMGLPAALEPVPTAGDPKKATLRCAGRSCEGFVIEALVGDRGPLDAELFSYRYILPAEGQPLVASRPRNAIPQYSPNQSVTLKRVRF